MNKKHLGGMSLVVYLLMSLQPFVHAKESPKTSSSQQIGPSYQKNTPSQQPFAPSYITVTDHRSLTIEDWQDPEICSGCHPRQYEGWSGSMHSNAFKDPIFQALWAIGEKATNGKTMNHCAGCHSPIGTITQSIKFDPEDGLHGSFSAPPIAEKGVSCDVCHSITGTNLNKTAVLEHGNSSFNVDPGKVKRGSLKDADSPFHEARYSAFHTSSEFCGNCHNIFHPENNFPIERTYDEWKYSIYAQNNIQCMDCHMVTVETAERVADELKTPDKLKNGTIGGFAAIGGPFRDVVHDHQFVGGNAVITQVLGGSDSDNYQAALRRLKGVASIDIHVKPQNGQLHNVTVRVHNNRAGHNLPTSLTEVRQVWVEVLVIDEKGKILLRSGSLQENNELPEDTVIFNAEAVDKNGHHTAMPWEITRFVRSNTIPPKGFKEAKYAFNIPSSSKNIKIIAKLNYRSFSQALADLLLGKNKIIVPHINMVTEEMSLPVHKGQAHTVTHQTNH